MLVKNIEMNYANNFTKVVQMARKVEQMTKIKTSRSFFKIGAETIQRLITNMNKNFEKYNTKVVPMEHKMASMCKNCETRNNFILG